MSQAPELMTFLQMKPRDEEQAFQSSFQPRSKLFLRSAAGFFSLLYIITGCLVLACAVYGKTKILGGEELNSAVWVAIFLGGLLASNGLIGFCGAFMNSVCICSLSAVLLGVLCISFGSLTAYMQDELDMAGTDVEEVLNSNMNNYDPQEPSSMHDMDSYQRVLKCCGVNSPEDWLKTKFQRIPSSCPPKSKSSQGCKEVIFYMVRETARTAVSMLGALTGFIGIGFVLTMSFSCLMFRRQLR